MKQILVTGANGFLGRNVVDELLQRGYRVRAIVRRPHDELTALGVECLLGDIRDSSSLMNAAHGCDAIIHIAATTRQNLNRRSYEALNVTPCRHIVAAAKEHNVRRIIYISTANAVGNGTAERWADELMPIAPPFSYSLYAYTKYLGEEIFKSELCDKEGVECVILNPSFMIGRYGSDKGSNYILTLAYKRPIVFTPPGGKNFIAVTDVSQAICNALTQGRNGERYLLTGENMSVRCFFQRMCKVTGQRSLIVTLPAWLLLFLGGIGSLLRKIGVSTDMTLNNMRILNTHEYLSNAKAKEELSLTLTPLEEAMKEGIRWNSSCSPSKKK